MTWKQIVKDYLNFSRRERIGVVIIAIVIILVWLSPRLLQFSKAPKAVPGDTAWMAAVQELEKTNNSQLTEADNDPQNINELAYEKSEAPKHIQLFEFDPNQLPAEAWKTLGIKERTVRTIQNYLAKGGRFYKPEDLKKIYGLHEEDFNRLKPYIRIENRENKIVVNTSSEKQNKQTKPVYKTTILDINTADTTAFIALPGIGSKLAARIVNFRDKLGGFYSIDQIAETYGLPDSTFQKIKSYLQIKNTEVKKININTATKDELKLHPYIKWNLANAIVEYRNQHGNYATLEDLKKISIITAADFEKIRFYLTL
ncbi:MAG: DNA-binding protein [Chitinophagaceae bacterium]